MWLLSRFSVKTPSTDNVGKLESLSERLAALSPKIEEIMRIAGTAGLSLGVVHQGHEVHQANFGFADVDSRTGVNEETIFPVCSFMKAVLSATIGTLVEEGKLQWSTLVKDVLPNFKIKDDTIRESTTIVDLLAHRTGMSVSDYYLGSDNNIWIAEEDSMKFLNDQQSIKPFRGQFHYNNLGYELAGHVIEAVTGRPWAQNVKDRILQPLGLHRTYTTAAPGDVQNVAKAYCTLDDATPFEIHTVQSDDHEFGGSSGGLRSCVKDLLEFYKAFMKAVHDQFHSDKGSIPSSPFKQVNHLISGKIPMDPPSFKETSYALGWARVQLPGPMGAVGCNPSLMYNEMPIVGRGSPSRLVLYHQGSLPGALAAANLIPETQSAVVVLTNSLALNDCADWVGQLVLEELLGVPENDKNDFVRAAEVSVQSTLAWHGTVEKELLEKQKQDPLPRPMGEYVGIYWNSIRIMKIVVFIDGNTLYWAAQGLESEAYPLKHYGHDSFTWLQTRDELTKRGRWIDQGAEFWKIRFHSGERSQIDSLTWVHDADIPTGQTFYKESSCCSRAG